VGPRNRTDYSDYGGTHYFEKTGAVDEQGAGGNTIADTATLVNTGSGYMMWGNSAADSFMVRLNLTNSGTRGIYVGNNQPNHYVGGDIIGTNTGTGTSTWIYVVNGATSTMAIDGDVFLSNTSSATTTQIGMALGGDATIGGDLTMLNYGPGATAYGYTSNSASASITVGGVTRIENGGSGTTHRSYLGSSGDFAVGDSLYLLNSSSASNSQIYVANAASSLGTIAGDIVVESSDAACDGVYFGSSNGTSTLAAGQTVTVGPNGFVAGTLYFRNFTQTGPTNQSLTLTGTSTFNNYSSSWGGNVTFTSPRFYTYNTDYDGTAYFEKTGSGSDASAGLNRITGNAELVNNGSGYFMMGNGAADSLLSNAIFTNSGTNYMYFANSTAGNYIGGDLGITQSTTGTNTYFYLANGGNSSLQVDGNTTITDSSTASNPRLYIGNSGDIDFNGTLDYSNTASGTNSYSYIATNGASTVTIDGVANFNQFNTGATTHYLYIGNNGDVTFGDSLYVRNNNSATNSTVYLNNGSTSANTYNGHIIIESYNATGDGISFGSGAGLGTLTAGNTVSVGPNGFSAGTLYFRNFDQQGGTVQSISLTGTTNIFSIYDSEWDGDLDFDAPRTYTNYSTYNGDFDFEKTGASNDASTGGNTYNGDVIFTNNGTGYQMIPNNIADDYNGDVSFIKTSTGLMYPSYSSNSTYAGDINFDANTSISLGASTGVIEMDGTGPQSINDLGTSTTPLFRRFEINNSADSVTLNMPIEIQTTVTFTDGILNTDTINILRIRDNATATGASDASFVYGYVRKAGNDAFAFPVGDSIYRPISISNPSSSAAVFRATYNYENPAPTYAYGLNDAPIDHHSTREYWMLDRLNTTSTVNVTLTWNVNSGGVDDLDDLLVARWDGDSWTSEGNGGTTGNTTTGTIVTSAAVTSFSPFTLASSTTNNPLPVELLEFMAASLDDVVEVDWATASETNNDYFTVERGIDAVNFEPLADILGAGNSVSRRGYDWVDKNPLVGISYYRLKQTDFDGSASYSNIDAVFRTASQEMKIYVAENSIEFLAENEGTESLSIIVRDASGKLIHQELWNKSYYQHIHSIDQSVTDAAGVYLISVEGITTQFTQTVFIP